MSTESKTTDLNWNPPPPPKCKRCGKIKGYHKSGSHACPVGLRTRAGYIHYSATDTFEPERKKP